MSAYRIYFTTGASASVEVEADDLEAAIELAYDVVPSGVCAQCSGWGAEYDLDLGDNWDVDENGHEIDGEYVDTSKAATA